MDYKKEEIKQYFLNFIEDNKGNDSWLEDNIDDLHHHCFNTDYYIIGTYQATKWLDNEVFNIIEFIKEYEMTNFDVVYTDFSDPEKVVNMYTYIIGQEIVNNWINDNYYTESNILLVR